MIKWTIFLMSALAAFATLATMAGVLMEKKLEAYGLAAALGYLFATVGFLFLVGWTYLKGHFKDVEEPKLKVLSAEAEDPR